MQYNAQLYGHITLAHNQSTVPQQRPTQSQTIKMLESIVSSINARKRVLSRRELNSEVGHLAVRDAHTTTSIFCDELFE